MDATRPLSGEESETGRQSECGVFTGSENNTLLDSCCSSLPETKPCATIVTEN